MIDIKNLKRDNIMLSKLIVGILCLSILSSCESNTPSYCEKLVEKVSDPKISSILEKWFDVNFHNKQISKDNYVFGGRFVPGSYTYKASFDWSLLDFDEYMSIIKLIDIDEFTVNSKIVSNINSVSLAERSRMNILIRSKNANDYGIGEDRKYLTEINDRIAILCIDIGF